MFANAIIRQFPFALTTFRCLLAPLVLLVACGSHSKPAFLACLLAAFLSDIFDGILARRLRIDTPALRRYDSAADVVFYAAAFTAIWIVHPRVASDHVPGMAAIAILELACIVLSACRFGRAPATHAYTAKLWGIFLFAACTALLGFGVSRGIFTAMVVVGILAEVEVLAILLISPQAPVDVPSIFGAIKRRGRTAVGLSPIS